MNETVIEYIGLIKSGDNWSKLSSAINIIVLDAVNHEISQWLSEQRSEGDIFTDDEPFWFLEFRISVRIISEIDFVEKMFLSVSSEKTMVVEFFKKLKDTYCKETEKIVSNYRKSMLFAKERLLTDAATEFNNFMKNEEQ